MEHRCDIAVVGAGPAGAATALYAARAGLDVALIDKRTFPRDKICGDAVARKSLSHLRELGVLDRVEATTHEPIGRAVLSSPDGHEVAIDLSSHEEPDPHMVCRREIFDNAIVETARTQCRVLEGVAVADVLRTNGRVEGVSLQDGSEIHARVVVGADGFDSVVARRLGFYKHDSSRWFVATRGYYRGLDVAPRTVEVHFFDETLPGFLWFFPTGDGITNVGLGLVHLDLKRRHAKLRDVHEAVIASPRMRARFKRSERIGEVHGWNLPTPDASRTLAGDGFLLVGDAAGLVDPFSGEGIGNALESAKVAANVIAESLRASDRQDLSRALASYPKLLWDAVGEREISLHYKLRSLARSRGLLNFIVGRAAARPDVLAWLQSMTAAHDAVARKATLLSPFTYARLLLRR
ncbi:MAG TPA: geranylgeranyl reductase family protein [Candidatus Krumholzibacteria bacterium]|nr:geranylgeranyl reductase family protein [Candidatus Krumholzibacteria bacterium]